MKFGESRKEFETACMFQYIYTYCIVYECASFDVCVYVYTVFLLV